MNYIHYQELKNIQFVFGLNESKHILHIKNIKDKPDSSLQNLWALYFFDELNKNKIFLKIDEQFIERKKTIILHENNDRDKVISWSTVEKIKIYVGTVIEVMKMELMPESLGLRINFGNEGIKSTILSNAPEGIILENTQVSALINLKPECPGDSPIFLLCMQTSEGKEIPFTPTMNVPNGSGFKI